MFERIGAFLDRVVIFITCSLFDHHSSFKGDYAICLRCNAITWEYKEPSK